MAKPDLTKMGFFDRTIDNCIVTSIPAGDPPKFIKVQLPDSDEAVIDAWWTGIPELEEDQSVSLRRSDGNHAQYTISGGGSGTAPPSAHTHLATEVTTDTTNFDGNLSAADTNVQLALETLDELNATSWPFDNVIHAKTDAELTAAVAAATANQTTIIIDCDIQLTDDIEIDKAISIVGFSGGYSVPTIKGPVAGGRCFTLSGTAADYVSFSNLTMETIETDILFATNRNVFVENCTFRFAGPVTGAVGGLVSLVNSSRVEDIKIKIFNCRFVNVDPGDSFGYGLWLVNSDTAYGTDALTVEVHHSAFAVVSSDIEAEESTIKLYDPVLPNGVNEVGCVVTGSWMDGNGNRLPTSDLTKATNTSGATVGAGDVGYLDELGEYKTTTTASDIKNWCAVVIGGADSTDIYVARQGTRTINYTGSAPAQGDYLTTSTVAGGALAQAYISPAIFAVCTAAGSGGTVEALLLTGRALVQRPDSHYLYGVNASSDSDFISTIATLPGGATFTYGAVSSGAENAIAPWTALDANFNGKLVIHNTIRGNSGLISSVTVGTNTVVLTANIPGDWQVGDTVTTRSQTNTNNWFSGTYYFDLDFSGMTTRPPLGIAIGFQAGISDTGGGGSIAAFHPFESNDNSKSVQVWGQVANIRNNLQFYVPNIQDRICLGWNATGAGTVQVFLQHIGWIEATP